MSRSGSTGAHRAPTRRGWLRGPARVGGRIVVGVVALAVLAVTGVGWSLDISGTSDAVAAAGNVGVVQAPGIRAAGAGGPATAPSTASIGPVQSVAQTAAVASTAAPAVPAAAAENILVVGADSRTDAQGNPLTKQQQEEVGVTLDGGGVNTDTMLIVHIPAGGGRATAISIPRDTWMFPSVVNAPGVTGPDQYGNPVHYLPSKINSFYSTAKYYDTQYLRSKGVSGPELELESDEAGRTMLIKIVQQFTGVKIDHYAEVNMLGFYLMSQAIGGVPVCLLHPVDDRQSGADFPAGYQTVEGKTALAFVRQRHGVPGGDLGRIKREQAFLGSALNQILSLGTLTNPARLAALLDAAHRSIVLDSGFDLLTFAEQMRGLAAGNVDFVTIPTTVATQITSTDALQADPVQVRAMFAAVEAGRPLPTGTGGTAAATSTTASSATRTSTSAGEATTSSTPPAPGGYQVPCVN